MKDFYATVEVRLAVEAIDEADARATVAAFVASEGADSYVSVKGMDVVAITEE